MPNPPEPDRSGIDFRHDPSGNRTASYSKSQPQRNPEEQQARQFTAPGFDAKETQIIATAPEAVTEVFQTRPMPTPDLTQPIRTISKIAVPQSIPPRNEKKARSFRRGAWGWMAVLIGIVAALVAIAILGTLLLAHSKHAEVSREDQVRHTIEAFDIAVQNGDLAALRGLTCGATRDSYAEYDEPAWTETYRRVSAAKQYPVITSIDQVVINDGYAEVNVTTFMAYDPQVRSTRSLDLQFRDAQWKICQSDRQLDGIG